MTDIALPAGLEFLHAHDLNEAIRLIPGTTPEQILSNEFRVALAHRKPPAEIKATQLLRHVGRKIGAPEEFYFIKDENDTIVAAALLMSYNGQRYIGWIGVDKERQGEKLAGFLMRKIMDDSIADDMILVTDAFGPEYKLENSELQAIVYLCQKHHPEFPDLAIEYTGCDEPIYGHQPYTATLQGKKVKITFEGLKPVPDPAA